jgi:hypothetical protein
MLQAICTGTVEFARTMSDEIPGGHPFLSNLDFEKVLVAFVYATWRDSELFEGTKATDDRKQQKF